MNKIKLILGPFQTNCYILESDNIAAVIDPGEGDERIIKVIGQADLKFIILTHFHFDHTRGVVFLKSRYPQAEILIHCAEKEYINHEFDGQKIILLKIDILGVENSWSESENKKAISFVPDRWLEDGDVIAFGQEKLTVVHSPGHTPGSICLFGLDVVFTGDTLFADGVGRTDLLGGSATALRESFIMIGKKIMPRTEVCPGHGEGFLF